MVYERGGEDVAERCVKTYYTMEGTVMKKSFRRISLTRLFTLRRSRRLARAVNCL